MDDTHREFIDLVNRLGKATGKEFAALFKDLYIHTEAHFSREYEMMKETGFPALEEHYAEHQRILGQLNHFLASVNKGRSSMARAYIREQMPYWFSTHLATMDSALAAHCKSISR